jgi:hypothetical protein
MVLNGTAFQSKEKEPDKSELLFTSGDPDFLRAPHM